MWCYFIIIIIINYVWEWFDNGDFINNNILIIGRKFFCKFFEIFLKFNVVV